MMQMRELRYQIQQKGSTIPTIKHYSEKMKISPLSQILRGGDKLESFDKAHIQSYMEQISIQNCDIFLKT